MSRDPQPKVLTDTPISLRGRGTESLAAAAVAWVQPLLPTSASQRGASQHLPVRSGICQPRLHSFCDQPPFELGHRTDHLEHQFTGWQRRIHRFRENLCRENGRACRICGTTPERGKQFEKGLCEDCRLSIKNE